MKYNTLLLLLAVSSAFVLTSAAPNELWLEHSLERNYEGNYFATILDRDTQELARIERELELEFVDCERKLNNTDKACEACIHAQCSHPPPPDPSFLDKTRHILKIPVEILKKPIKAVGKAISKLTKGAANILKKGVKKAVSWLSKDVKDKVKNVVKSVGKKVGKVVKKVGRGAAKIAKKVLNTGKNIGRGIARLAKKFASGAKKVVKSVGRRIANTAKRAWRGIKKFFGRRRRSLSAEERECYNRCPPCTIHTLSSETEITKHVCGEPLLKKNARMYRLSQRVSSLGDTIDFNDGSIIKITYPLSGINHATGISHRNKVVGKFEGESLEYTTTLPLMVSGPKTEKQRLTDAILDEFMNKWDQRLNEKYNL